MKQPDHKTRFPAINAFFKTFLRMGIPFGILTSIFYIIVDGLVQGVIKGIYSGLFFGLFIAVITTIHRTNLKGARPRQLSEETLIKEDIASCPNRILAVRGSLFLSKKNLRFIPYQRSKMPEVDINLAEIKQVRIKSSLGIIKNRLILFDYMDHKREFIVEGAQEWAKKINELKGFNLLEP